MPANWSLILNILLLLGVIFTIGRLIKSRRKDFIPASNELPSLGEDICDDIIAVRKINIDLPSKEQLPSSLRPRHGEKVPEGRKRGCVVRSSSVDVCPRGPGYSETETTPGNKTFVEETRIKLPAENKPQIQASPAQEQHLMIFLLAKDNRKMAGYELLQTILAAGLRFGEGNLFHRHQHADGQGAILCSLAAATQTGTFDLQNMGAFSAKGLCLFMQACGNPTIDAERFTVMYETAKQLRDGLDAHLLDEQRQPLDTASIARYQQTLHI